MGNDVMKTTQLLLMIAAGFVLSACEMSVSERRPTSSRRYISYSDREPYYRVYYREPDGRSYYRRHYYDDDATYRTRVDTRRYYTRGPIDRTYSF
jgi:hypothetical protein